MCLTDNLRQIRNVLLALLCQIAEKFNVALWALMGENVTSSTLKPAACAFST